ncbi:hypothetical protein J6590_029589 [Homalodisca vitripennis]|nr:hypothetical protein J6590_029589 [Homalodisca vitripennis]
MNEPAGAHLRGSLVNHRVSRSEWIIHLRERCSARRLDLNPGHVAQIIGRRSGERPVNVKTELQLITGSENISSRVVAGEEKCAGEPVGQSNYVGVEDNCEWSVVITGPNKREPRQAVFVGWAGVRRRQGGGMRDPPHPSTYQTSLVSGCKRRHFVIFISRGREIYLLEVKCRHCGGNSRLVTSLR